MGICESSSDLPERYGGVTTVGMAMNPDLEIIKSLNPDYVLSPNTLQNDLQPKYASIGSQLPVSEPAERGGNVRLHRGSGQEV